MSFKNILLSTSIAFSSAAFSCEKPELPAMPDPDTAVTAQMIKAKNEMGAFITAAEVYLKCVERDVHKHNQMIDEMQAAADQFNAIVRKYKARMENN